MKKQNINNDAYISEPSQTLNIEIDSETWQLIHNAIRPNTLATPPKGFYSNKQLAKLMKMSRCQLGRKVKKLKKENKVEEIKCLEKFGNRFVTVPYYKFLTRSVR